MELVVCPEPPAARVGREIFAAGGNAMDAAIATAFAQGVTNPLLCGLGGTGLLYYYDAVKRENVILDCSVTIGSVPVPESWASEFGGRAETIGRYILQSEANQVGYQSVMTPGFVRGCWVAFQRYGSGRLTWSDLLAPAVALARDGFEVYPYIAGFWRNAEDKPGYPSLMRKLHATPDATRFYLKPDGSVYGEGDRFTQPVLAETLERLAKAGGDDFYSGEIAATMADDFEKHAGLINRADLSNYRIRETVPLRGSYRGFDIASTPSSGSGAQIIQILQILEHFDLGRLGHNCAEYVDTFARIQRATFADNVRLKCLDVQEAQAVEQELIAPERAEYWAERITRGDRISVRGGAVDPGTTHLTCVDENRNIACFTHSIGSLGGAGVITPGLGFLCNNFLGHFNPLPGHADSIAPNKRGGGGAPTMVFENGEPYIAIGAPGGSRIFTAIVQSLVNVIDYGMDMRTAVTAPRFHSEEQQLVFIEPAFSEDTARTLRAIGNDVRRSAYMSRVQAIRLRGDTGELEAGADPRGGAGIGQYPLQAAGGG